MSAELYNKLNDVVRTRDWASGQQDITDLTNVYEGELPAQYDRYFPKDSPKHVVNLIRLALDDLSTQIGRIPDLRAEPKDQTNREQKAVGLFEKIGHSYLRNSKPSGKELLKQLAFWLLLGRAVIVVIPDEEKKSPIFSIRDPRTCYPGVKESVGNQIVELSDIMFKYELPIQEMKNRGLMPKAAEDGMEDTKGWVIEYLDDTQWVVISEGGTVQRSEHDLGMVPGHVFQAFSPNKKHGLSQFGDQISFMVMISQLLSMKLAHAERSVYPVTWVKGHEGSIRVGPNVLNKLGPSGEMGQLSPPTTLQVDRDIQLLGSYSRILNRNPESRQGEISGSQYKSAKTLEQMNEAIDTVVGRYWDTISVGLQKLFAIAYAMDEKLWGKVEKSIHFTHRNRPVDVTYIPDDDIGGRRHVNVDYGFGLGGYQGFLQNMQAMDAKLLPRKRVMEEMPGVSDVDANMRQIEMEQMDEAGTAMFQQQAATGQMDMVLWATLRKEMAKSGTPLHEIIVKYQETLQEQAQAAQSQGGAESLTTPGPPEEEAVEEQAQLQGIPPSALVGG